MRDGGVATRERAWPRARGEPREGARQHLQIVGVADAGDVPAVPQEARGHVLAERQGGVTFDGDAVVIIDPAQVGELILRVDGLDAREVQQRVEEHRAMARRQHEAVAVRPKRVVWIEAQELLPQAIDDGGHPHGRARVAGVRLLHRIHDQCPNGVDTELIDVFLRVLGHPSLLFGVKCRMPPAPATITSVAGPRNNPCSTLPVRASSLAANIAGSRIGPKAPSKIKFP